MSANKLVRLYNISTCMISICIFTREGLYNACFLCHVCPCIKNVLFAVPITETTERNFCIL